MKEKIKKKRNPKKWWLRVSAVLLVLLVVFNYVSFNVVNIVFDKIRSE